MSDEHKSDRWKNFRRSLKGLFVPQRKSDLKVTCANAMLYFGTSQPSLNSKTKSENTCEKDKIKFEYNENHYPNSSQYENSSTSSNSNEKESFLQKCTHWCKHFSLKKSIKHEEHELKKEIHTIEELEEDEMFISTPLDTFIGYAVDMTGSIYMFFLVIIIIIAWVVWGIVTGAPDVWQIVLQDGQSIQTYVWDTFLMRQQLDDHEKFLVFIGKLQSRTITHTKLLQSIRNYEIDHALNLDGHAQEEENINDEGFDIHQYITYDKKNWFNKMCDFFSKILGSLTSVIIYWLGIFAWIGCGALENNNGTKEHPDYQTFSNNWQMYINTATGIVLLFTSVFLENSRAATNGYILKQMAVFNEYDRKLEYNERMLTNYYDDNQLVIVHQTPRDKMQQWILTYSTIIGNGLGLIISTCVFIVWVAVGDLLGWDDDWWLVIGTYTGLVGFIDGFVLREVFYSITNYEMQKFKELLDESQTLYDVIGIQQDCKLPERDKTMTIKISLWVNRVCSTKWSVLFSVIAVIGLIIFATALLWSETAQLVCNTPTMIIEGFFLLILIQAQDWACEDRIDVLTELTKNRILITKYVDRFSFHKTEYEKQKEKPNQLLDDNYFN